MFQKCEFACNGMYIFGNEMYFIDKESKDPKLEHYPEILPFHFGQMIQSNSPFCSILDRKLLFLIKNPNEQTPKEALVLPFPTDSYIPLNAKMNQYAQYSQFIEPPNCEVPTLPDVLTYTPNTETLTQTSVFGKVKKIIDLERLF